MENRKQRRVSRSAMMYIPFGVLLVAIISIMGISSFLRIMVIEVEGATRYSSAEIISASGIGVGDNLLFLDTDAAQRRIMLAMPFIREVNVLRALPDGIMIEIFESEPIASIEDSGDLLIIDVTGRILERTDKAPDGLIEVRGITPLDPVEGGQLRTAPGGEMQLQYMRDVLSAMERERIVQDVTFLDITHISQINFGYLGRFRVILGGPSNIRGKLEALPRVIDTIAEDISATIDLTDLAAGARVHPGA